MMPTTTLAELRSAIAEQDRRLAAAFEALDPKVTIAVPIAGLRLLAETCGRAADGPPPAGPTTWGKVRC
jgi:hypothetical protein